MFAVLLNYNLKKKCTAGGSFHDNDFMPIFQKQNEKI